MAKDPRPKSKAAQETARLKAEREAARPASAPIEGLPPAEQPRTGGLLTRMRGGFQAVAGQGEKGKKNKVLDILLWIAVIAAAVIFFARRV